MIVIDTSVLVAVYLQENDALVFAMAIEQDSEPLISAGSLLEASLVLRGLKKTAPTEAEAWLDDFLKAAKIRTESVTADQIRIARDAHIRFGRGSGHPARLNYGDCFAYALSRAFEAPLLFKGADFSATDVKQVLPG